MTDAAGLDALAAKQFVPGYIGFDATAPSLHVGSLVQIMMLRRLQQAGHKPIVLMGGGTTKIGDPSGKDESRRLLTPETIRQNIASIRMVFERLLTFGDGPTDAIMVDNDEWLRSEEHTSELQSLMRISYAVLGWKKKKQKTIEPQNVNTCTERTKHTQ